MRTLTVLWSTVAVILVAVFALPTHASVTTCSDPDALTSRQALDEFGFSHMLLDWYHKDIDANACFYDLNNKSANKLCDDAQALSALLKQLAAVYKNPPHVQGTVRLFTKGIILLKPFPDKKTAIQTINSIYKNTAPQTFLLDVFSKLPQEEEYFKGPGLYLILIYGYSDDGNPPYRDINFNIIYIQPLEHVFPDATRLKDNLYAFMPYENRKQLFYFTPPYPGIGVQKVYAPTPGEAQSGVLLTIFAKPVDNTNFKIFGITYTPTVPATLFLETKSDATIYYAMLDINYEFFASSAYDELPESYFLEWSNSMLLYDELREQHVDGRCDGWMDARDVWQLSVPAQERLRSVVFLPEGTSIAFPCVSSKTDINAYLFDAKWYLSRSVRIPSDTWFGAGNIITAPKLNIDALMPTILSLVEQGALCVKAGADKMEFLWNRNYFLEKQPEKPVRTFVLEVPYDAERNVLEHEGLPINAFGISHQGNYLIKAYIPQTLLLDNLAAGIKLTVKPTRVHSAVLKHLNVRSTNDVAIQCIAEADYNSYAETVLTTDASFVAVEGVPMLCDLKVKGSLYQKVPQMFILKVERFELREQENKLLVYLSFAPALSPVPSFFPVHASPVNTQQDLDYLRELLWQELSKLLPPETPYHSFEECVSYCEKQEECLVTYCDMFSTQCEEFSLEGMSCQDNNGVCVGSTCIPKEQLPEKSEKCPDVQCISSECTTRYLDEDTCTCKETRLNGKECDGGKGICDNGVCKPKDSYFSSLNSVTVVLETQYLNGITKAGDVKQVTAPDVSGHGSYVLSLGAANVGQPPIESVLINIGVADVDPAVASKYSASSYELYCHIKSDAAHSDATKGHIYAEVGVVYSCDLAPNDSVLLREQDVLDIVVKDISVLDDMVRVTVVISFNPLSVMPGIPPTFTCEEITCEDDLANCRVASCYDGKCQYAPAPVGTPCGQNSYCTAEGLCKPSSDTQPPEPAPIMSQYTLVFLPLSWEGSDELFADVATRFANYFINMAELSECKNKIDIQIINKQTVEQECPELNLPTFLTSLEALTLNRNVRDCGERLTGVANNASNYRIIAISDNEYISSSDSLRYYGYTYPYNKAVIVLYKPRIRLHDCTIEDTPKERPMILAHELGHTFGFCEQYSSKSYLDLYIKLGCMNYYPGELRDESGNVIVPYMKCSYNTGEYETNCPEIPPQERCGVVDCLGRKIPYQGMMTRDVMGVAGVGPRPFDCFELDAIKSRWSC